MPKAPKKKVNQAAIVVDAINAAAFLRATNAAEAAQVARQKAEVAKVAKAAKVGTSISIPRPEANIELESKIGLKKKFEKPPKPEEKTTSKIGRPQTKPESEADQQQESGAALIKESEATPDPELKLQPVIFTRVFEPLEPIRPVSKGHRTVLFQGTTDWTSRFGRHVGYKTRSMTFGSQFVLSECVLFLLHVIEYNTKPAIVNTSMIYSPLDHEYAKICSNSVSSTKASKMIARIGSMQATRIRCDLPRRVQG